MRFCWTLLWFPPFFLLIPVATRKREVNFHVDETETWTESSLQFSSTIIANISNNNYNNTITNVTAQLGTTAFLHCTVQQRQASRSSAPTNSVSTNGNANGETQGSLVFTKQISWIRRRDWHILSSGMFMYTNDDRFQILHVDGSDDWIMQIKYVQKRDTGMYECQISTGSGILSQFVNLNIIIPLTYIVGSREYHVDVGSTIQLTCVIEHSPTPPQYVFWYHNDRMINYDVARGTITVTTEPGEKTKSQLVIKNARDSDSGNYTCSPSNADSASVNVYVSAGDKMAAILRRNLTSTAYQVQSSMQLILKILSILNILCTIR